MPARRRYVRFKKHRNYSVQEIAEIAGRHEHTVREWLRSGLNPIEKRRPLLFLGSELNRFLDERRKRRKTACPPGTIYCLPCRAPQRPAERMVDYLPSTPSLGNLRGICPDCGRLIHRRVALASIEVAARDLEVAFPVGRHRIRESPMPSVNRDFGSDPRP